MKKSRNLMALAMTREENDDFADARKNYSLVLKDEPDNIDALRGKARCLILHKDNPSALEEGLEIINKVINIHIFIPLFL